MSTPVKPRRNFYGRLKGHNLKASQKVYLEEDLAPLSPGAVDWDANPARELLDMDAMFAGKPAWLEVGFGGGEHMVHQAANNRDVGIIGCEPYINGVAMLLGKIRQAEVDNVKVHPGDVRDMFEVLPDESISKAFLLYPDPWPKTRHHRRRFVKRARFSAWRQTLKTMCARPCKRCRALVLNGWPKGQATGASRGMTGSRPAMSKRHCARGGCRTT